MIATIAIVDDDESVRDSTRLLLECWDYAVREHASAEDFLLRPRDDVNCVLVDHHMPGMTGLDLLERLREDGDLIPALIITGGADPIMESRARRVGAALLRKPVPEEQLVRSIELARRIGDLIVPDNPKLPVESFAYSIPRATKSGLWKPGLPQVSGFPSNAVTLPPAAASTVWPAAVSYSMVLPSRG